MKYVFKIYLFIFAINVNAQNVGIGTTMPSAKLHVNGTFKLTDGSKGEGKILKSNAQGLATWTTPSSLPSSVSDPAGYGNWGPCENPLLSHYQPLSGKKPNDYFGWAVDMNDEYAFISAPGFDTLGLSYCGVVYVYKINNGIWTYKDALLDPDGQNDDGLGGVIVVDGNFMAVSVLYDDVAGYSNAGSVILFWYTGSKWVYFDKITEPTPGTNAYFGKSIALRGDKLVIGSPEYGTTGRAYVNEYYSGSWSLAATLQNTSGTSGDQFGGAVAVHNDMVAVSAPEADLDSMDQGFIIIYQKFGSVYSQIQYLTVTGYRKNIYYGRHLFLHDNFLMASSSRFGSYLYSFDGSMFTDEIKISKFQYYFNTHGSKFMNNGKMCLINARYDPITNKLTNTPYIYKKLNNGFEVYSEVNLGAKVDFISFDISMNEINNFIIGCPHDYSNTGKVLFGKIN